MSKDTAKKKAGPPDSLSRAHEKANKRNTKKKRRQDDRKQGRLDEKAVSKAQQRFMAMVAHGKIDAPKGLSKKEARKFAKTKHDGLPETVGESLTSFKLFFTLTENINSFRTLLQTASTMAEDEAILPDESLMLVNKYIPDAPSGAKSQAMNFISAWFGPDSEDAPLADDLEAAATRLSDIR